MNPYELREPDDERDRGDDGGYDDWYRLIGPDPTPEEMPDTGVELVQGETLEDTGVLAEKEAEKENDDEDRGPIPFGEDGAAFLRNVLQHGLFLGIGMLILMIIRYARDR